MLAGFLLIFSLTFFNGENAGNNCPGFPKWKTSADLHAGNTTSSQPGAPQRRGRQPPRALKVLERS